MTEATHIRPDRHDSMREAFDIDSDLMMQERGSSQVNIPHDRCCGEIEIAIPQAFNVARGQDHRILLYRYASYLLECTRQ